VRVELICGHPLRASGIGASPSFEYSNANLPVGVNGDGSCAGRERQLHIAMSGFRPARFRNGRTAWRRTSRPDSGRPARRHRISRWVDAWRRRASRNPATPRNAVSPARRAPRGAPLHGGEAAANPWLGAIARCSRTGSSNPSPSSRESTNFRFRNVSSRVFRRFVLWNTAYLSRAMACRQELMVRIRFPPAESPQTFGSLFALTRPVAQRPLAHPPRSQPELTSARVSKMKTETRGRSPDGLRVASVPQPPAICDRHNDQDLVRARSVVDRHRYRVEMGE
jgi:hypothetical protein